MDLKLYSLGFDATWEMDIFGGMRRSIEAANDSADAALWQMRDGEVTLTAEIAADYIGLRATQARLAILNAEVARQNDTLALTSAKGPHWFCHRAGRQSAAHPGPERAERKFRGCRRRRG